MGSNKASSYNRHYVKWMVNWWKIPVFKIAHKSFYVKCHFNVIPKFMNLCLNSLSFFTHIYARNKLEWVLTRAVRTHSYLL